MPRKSCSFFLTIGMSLGPLEEILEISRSPSRGSAVSGRAAPTSLSFFMYAFSCLLMRLTVSCRDSIFSLRSKFSPVSREISCWRQASTWLAGPLLMTWLMTCCCSPHVLPSLPSSALSSPSSSRARDFSSESCSCSVAITLFCVSYAVKSSSASGSSDSGPVLRSGN